MGVGGEGKDDANLDKSKFGVAVWGWGGVGVEGGWGGREEELDMPCGPTGFILSFSSKHQFFTLSDSIEPIYVSGASKICSISIFY